VAGRHLGGLGHLADARVDLGLVACCALGIEGGLDLRIGVGEAQLHDSYQRRMPSSMVGAPAGADSAAWPWEVM
jgi:hypothetical protein